jgi:hypothetical protein
MMSASVLMIDHRPPAGSGALRRIGAEPERPLNHGCGCRTFRGRSLVSNHEQASAIVPKTSGISSTPAENSDTAQFTSVALFSGVGLLISLIVVILRINGIF